MSTYLLKRVVQAVPVIVGVSILIFLMVHLIPGDPVRIMLRGTRASPQQIENLRHELGLDQPLHLQYIHWGVRVLQGDWGRSIRSHRPVLTEIVDRLPNTMRLAGAGISLAIIVGMSMGVLAAIHYGSWLDSIFILLAQFGVSTPHFFSGILLIFIFAVQLHWFPSIGGEGKLTGLILPTITIGLDFSAVIARLTRSSMLSVLNEDYILVARAKGLAERIVIYRHALKNALIPVITIIGLQFGYLLGSAVVVETVFARRGIGSLAVKAVLGKDFPLIQGVVLFMAISYVVINIVVDLSYAYLDPRIKYS